MIVRAALAAFCCLASTAAPAVAAPLEGVKTIKLVDGAGAETPVATIAFEPAAGGATYTVAWDDAPFADHFLSMRPFKCVEGTEKYWCRVPYPYENRRVVSADDLTDLEYDLLFIWKGATEYGINMWNGVYYRLEIEGDRIVGRIHEMDMDVLSAPPDDGDLRPVRDADLEEGEPDGHWLPVVVVE